jgi:hypothetical protein
MANDPAIIRQLRGVETTSIELQHKSSVNLPHARGPFSNRQNQFHIWCSAPNEVLRVFAQTQIH